MLGSKVSHCHWIWTCLCVIYRAQDTLLLPVFAISLLVACSMLATNCGSKNKDRINHGPCGGGHLCMIPHIGYQLPILETTYPPPLLVSDTISNLTFHTPPPIWYRIPFQIWHFIPHPPPNFPNLIRFEELFSKNGIFLVKNGMF